MTDKTDGPPVDHEAAKRDATKFIEAERFCKKLVPNAFVAEANLSRAYLDLDKQITAERERVSELSEELDWQNQRNSGQPTRGGYEFYASEGWAECASQAAIMRDRYDPDDDRVRVRRVAEDNQLLADLTAERKTVRETEQLLGNLLALIHGDGGQYISKHGWEKACADAEAVVIADRARVRVLEAIQRAWKVWNQEKTKGVMGRPNEAFDELTAFMEHSDPSGANDRRGKA